MQECILIVDTNEWKSWIKEWERRKKLILTAEYQLINVKGTV